ncbi:MAG: hypothetical protein CV087_22100 [Candidatus Brocadia sp. WS118]|nr:MAG: hypothetical protein CV087_22100 [Candidatus Brocadia sp. WS118]
MGTRKMHSVLIARRLRRAMTKSERELWSQLRNRKFRNLKFLRQHPIIYRSLNGNTKFFIADFYCDELRLVVELDGPIHDKQKDCDDARDRKMNELGLKVLRIKNEDAWDLEGLYRKMVLIQSPEQPVKSLIF